MELFIKILLTILAGTLMYCSYMYMSHKLIEESVKIKAEVTKTTTRATILEANKIYKPSMSYEGVNNYLNTLISDTFNDRYLENLILKRDMDIFNLEKITVALSEEVVSLISDNMKRELLYYYPTTGVKKYIVKKSKLLVLKYMEEMDKIRRASQPVYYNKKRATP